MKQIRDIIRTLLANAHWSLSRKPRGYRKLNAMVSFTSEMSTSIYKGNLSHPFYQTS